MALVEKSVRFIQYKIPRLKAGEYSVSASLVAGPKTAPVSYPTTTRGFAVTAPRFRLDAGDLSAVFPPNLANGEFVGTLPHAVLAKPVMPWLRTAFAAADKAQERASTPWLAVLTLQADELAPPAGTLTPVVAKTIADLVPDGTRIEVAGAAPLSPAVYGTMPTTTRSYPGLAMLDYGEAPTDPVNVVDLPVDLFTRIAPMIADLDFLAHLRETDTFDTVDSRDLYDTRSIVLGNRCARAGAPALALLVSLEQLSDCLPTASGTAGPGLGAATTIRLAVLTSWTFTPNAGGEDLVALLRGLDADAITSLRLPAAPVAAATVTTALADEADGVTPGDAAALVGNALNAGYVALGHHLRQAGQTVSWYRGPLLPYGPAAAYPFESVAGPDAMLRYDPDTGMFDTSYAAAWQLGQLMGLRARTYAVALYRWKRQVDRATALAEEQKLLDAALTPTPGATSNDAAAPFAALFRRRRAAVAAPPAIPPAVIEFIGSLRRLENIPFGYLVPDERMLPPESLRFFTVDPNWCAALVDGAFSIGRTSADQVHTDAATHELLMTLGAASARTRRRNDRPSHALLKGSPADAAMQTITGVLIRSQAIRGWPRLQIDGYTTTDDSGDPDVAKLRMEHLSADVLLCLFDGPVAMIAIHEPPEQLHSGVEFQTQGGETTAWTTLRAVAGNTPGRQYPEGPAPQTGVAQVPLRADLVTTVPATAAVSIQTAINTQFHAGIGPLASNDYALEMVKGVVRVEYAFSGAAHG